MKKIITLLSFATLSVFLVNCSSGKKTAVTTPAENVEKTPADKVAEIRKNYTAQQLEEGKTIWQGSCDKCHKLYLPESRSVQKWENVLPRMSKRSKLSDEQAGLVRAYIIANAKSS